MAEALYFKKIFLLTPNEKALLEYLFLIPTWTIHN